MQKKPVKKSKPNKSPTNDIKVIPDYQPETKVQPNVNFGVNRMLQSKGKRNEVLQVR